MRPETTMLELADGTVTTIDREDVARVIGYTWHVVRTRGKQMPVATVCAGYLSCKDIYLDRLITNASPEELVLHRNHDTLDNRRDNLVVVSRSSLPVYSGTYQQTAISAAD